MFYLQLTDEEAQRGEVTQPLLCCGRVSNAEPLHPKDLKQKTGKTRRSRDRRRHEKLRHRLAAGTDRVAVISCLHIRGGFPGGPGKKGDARG